MKRRWVLLSLCFPLIGLADERCRHALSGHSEVIFLNSNDPRQVIHETNLKKRMAIAKKLGFSLDAHRATFLNGKDLADFVAVGGRLPIPHEIDGGAIAERNLRNLGVMELVQPCPHVHRSFNNASQPTNYQIQIFDHVLGHNDFAAHSLVLRGLDADIVRASHELTELLAHLYQTENAEEISDYVRWVWSLTSLQDYAKGNLHRPEFFSQDRRDKLPSASVLQAVTQHLPPGAPHWKHEVIQKIEELHRSYPLIANTKIINEGWAVFAQLMITWFSDLKDQSTLMDFASLLSMVASEHPNGLQESIKNPYWLGIQGWLNLWENYQKRPEVQKQTRLEQAQGFIHYGHQVISHSTDREFIKLAFDAGWVEKKALFLTRPAQKDEQNSQLTPKEDQIQWIVVSDDPDVIINRLVHSEGRKELQYPRLLLTDPNDQSVFVLEQEMSSHQGPLKPSTTIQILHALVRVLERPVRLRTIARSAWLRMGGEGAIKRAKKMMENDQYHLEVEIELHPDGSLRTKEIRQSKSRVDNPALLPFYKKLLERHLQDLHLPTKPLNAVDNQGVPSDIVDGIIDSALSAPSNNLGVDSFSADALSEYQRALKRRIPTLLSDLLHGRVKSQQTKTGFRIQALPPVPHLSFDETARRYSINRIGPRPIDLPMMSSSESEPIEEHPADDCSFGSGRRSVGERYLGPKPKSSSSSSGGGGGGSPSDSDETGEPQEGDDGDPSGGISGAKSPSYLEIPFELFGQYLANYIEIPNLRPKGSRSVIDLPVRIGSVRNPSGPLKATKTAKRIIERAIGMKIGEGEPWEHLSFEELFEYGLRFWTPDLRVVSDRRDEPVPQTNIVVTVAIDLTASMSGKPLIQARRIIGNLELMLRAKYHRVEFRFIGFDTQAREFPKEKIYQINLGGGTEYIAGVKAANEIFQEYSAASWNRVFVLVGDFEDYSEVNRTAALRLLAQMSEELEYIAAFNVESIARHNSAVGTVLASELRDFIQTHPEVQEKMRIVRVGTDAEEAGSALIEMFPKKK